MKVPLIRRGFFLPVVLFSVLSNAADISSDLIQNVDDAQGTFLLKSEETRKAKALAGYAEALMEFKKESKIDEKKASKFIEILKNDPDAEIPLAFVIAAWNQNREKSSSLAEKIYDIAKANPQILKLNIAAATMLLGSQKEKEARSLLENAVLENEDRIASDKKVDKVLVNIAEVLAALYQKSKDFEKGDSLLEKFLKPDSVYCNDFNIVRSAVLFYRSAKASASPDTFLLLFPSDKERYSKEYDRAFSEIEKLCFKKYHSPQDLAPLIEVCRMDKDMERAKYLVSCNLLSSPKDLQSLELLAFIFSENGEGENALRIFRYLDRMNYFADNPHIYLEFAKAAVKSNNFKEAAESLEWYSTVCDDNPGIYYMLGLVYLDMGLYRKALARLSKAPQDFRTYSIKSLCYGKLGNHKDALDSMLLAEAAATSENKQELLNRDFYFMLAYLADKADSVEKVENALEKILSRSPEDHEALNFLGYVWAENGIKLDKAELIIASALVSDGKNPAYLDSMAWVLFKKGKIKEALKYIDSAIKEQGDSVDPVLLDHAGDIYFAAGKKEEALKFWKEASETYSEDLNPEKVRKKIAAAK
ncbi:MAG: hypothetical protein A2020_13570 [Lentisphaerae bacterium GWF2_45_14]|nr:MAG: hypothetical protein A2020_13570 [Lentisphaerae bacterium GWF2_45_14]